MFPHPAKLAGPVTIQTPDSDTVILSCDRGLKWPAFLALVGLGLISGSFWIPALLLFSPFFGIACIVAAFYFVALRAEVVLCRKTATVELRPTIPWFQKRQALKLPFSSIREFLVESEFELGIEKPFVWHLTAITTDGKQCRLTWHFVHDPVFLAGQEAARVTGKPLRQESDPWKSSTWSRWGYNFLR
jgi:hypothetical protein